MAGKNLIEQFEESSIATTTNNSGLIGRSSDETPQLDSVSTISSTNTSKRPSKFNGTSKVGEFTGPITLTEDDSRGFVGFEPQLQAERAKNIELSKITLEKQNVKIKGKYPEYNYVTIDLADFSELATGPGNIYIPLPKTPKPPKPPIPDPIIITPPTDEPTDSGPSNVQVNTLGTAEASATITQTNFTGQNPPFGVVGYPGEIRVTPGGRYFIWVVFNGIGRWRPYEPGSGGGAASTSGGVGAIGLGGLGGNGGGSTLGGGSTGNDDGGPGGGRPGGIR
jgi:hypothetical protein